MERHFPSPPEDAVARQELALKSSFFSPTPGHLGAGNGIAKAENLIPNNVTH
jgi:hypothetical protein